MARQEDRKQQTRERLLTAARQLFVSRGFDETSFDDIARAAGVARQTAFNHFPRKDDFVTAWVAERRAAMQSAMAAYDAGPSARRASAAARLLVIMRVMADDYEQRRDEGRVFIAAWVRSGGPIVEEPVAAHLFAGVVRDGQRDGEFVDDIDPKTAGDVIRAVYLDVLWRWAGPQNKVPVGAVRSAHGSPPTGADRSLRRSGPPRVEAVHRLRTLVGAHAPGGAGAEPPPE